MKIQNCYKKKNNQDNQTVISCRTTKDVRLWIKKNNLSASRIFNEAIRILQEKMKTK